MYYLKKCDRPHRLHFEILSVYTNNFLKEEDIKDIRETFNWMDEDNSGTVEVEEIRTAFHFMQDAANTKVSEQ